jgi:hypothetical protein
MQGGFLANLKRSLLVVLQITGVIMMSAAPAAVRAGSLGSPTDMLSNDRANAIGVTHTIRFNIASTSYLQQVTLQFSTTQGGSTRPAGLSLSGTSLGSVTGAGSDWTLDRSTASMGLLTITNSTPVLVTTGTALTIAVDNITNSAINNCEINNGKLEDTCWIHITTYSDEGSTSYDSGDATYTVEEDPSLVFSVSGMPAGTTENGITSTFTANATNLQFQDLQVGSVIYLMQKLSITTNAPDGYTIYVETVGSIQSSDGFRIFSPFGATDATWSTPKPWMTPTGIITDSNSGWIGANTSDTRVSGWGSATGDFGPVSSIPHPVAYSSGPDRGGSTIYVTYAMGVNSLQAAEDYNGSLIYFVQPIY